MKGRSELAFCFTCVSPILQGPVGQYQLTEVHVALVESLYAVSFIVDVVGHVLQVLQVRPM